MESHYVPSEYLVDSMTLSRMPKKGHVVVRPLWSALSRDVKSQVQVRSSHGWRRERSWDDPMSLFTVQAVIVVRTHVIAYQ